MDQESQPCKKVTCHCANHSWAQIDIVKLKATYTNLTMCILQIVKPKAYE